LLGHSHFAARSVSRSSPKAPPMLSSSASAGELAEALAKAQVELVNPEKSLATWISLPNDRSPPRRFRC